MKNKDAATTNGDVYVKRTMVVPEYLSPPNAIMRGITDNTKYNNKQWRTLNDDNLLEYKRTYLASRYRPINEIVVRPPSNFAKSISHPKANSNTKNENKVAKIV